MRKGTDAAAEFHRKADARLRLFLSWTRERLVATVRSEEARILRFARERIDRKRDTGVEPDLATAAPITAGLHARADGLVASVFILSDASADDLRALGAAVRSQAGDLFTATIPVDAIERLLASSAVRFMELGRPHFGDAANPPTAGSGIGNLHAAVPPVRGQGVIAGVLDRGMDFHHADFRDGAGNSRLLFLWDQELTPTAGESGPPAALLAPGSPAYGVEYSKGAIDAALSAYVPAAGNAYSLVRHRAGAGSHGTHVAGILAGNGSADPACVGAAPGSDIVFVHYPSLFDTGVLADSTYLADGFAYVFARAAALGKPAVVNLSVSDDQSAHDGTTLGERFIDALLALPGRAVSVSAGNANGLSQHAAGQVPVAGTAMLELTYPAGAVNSDAIEIWYSGLDRFNVTVTVPGTPSGVIGPLAAGGGKLSATVAPGVDVTVQSIVDDARNHDNLISVVIILQGGAAIPAGTWTLALAGTAVVNGRFDAWIDRNNRTAATMPRWRPPWAKEGSLTLGVPSTCRSVLAVANLASPAAGSALHPSSGCGFSRDGRAKPDLAALGTEVNATNSRDMDQGPGAPAYRLATGTSQAAPLVAGACALMFECRGGSAAWGDLHQILTDTAGRQGVPAVPDPAFGFGRLSVAAACSLPRPVVDVWLRDDATDLGAEPFVGAVGWLSPDIELLDTALNPATHPTHDPARRYGNVVRVTVRNRGTSAANNTAVHLYWADPSTNIVYPADWNDGGFFVGSPAFATAGNVVAVPSIPAGGFAQVLFAWAPPAAGGNLAGDGHYCLLARAENPDDPSPVGTGGWSSVAAHNNIALHNLDVVNTLPGGDSVSEFDIVGGEGSNALEVAAHFDRDVIVEIPAVALPWRDSAAIERYRARAADPDVPRGWVGEVDARIEGARVRTITDIVGASAIEVRGGQARVRIPGSARVSIPTLHVERGTRIRVRVRLAPGSAGRMHVGQLCGGRRTGGVSIEGNPSRGRRAKRA